MSNLKIVSVVVAMALLTGCNSASNVKPAAETETVKVQSAPSKWSWGVDRTYWQAVKMEEARLLPQ